MHRWCLEMAKFEKVALRSWSADHLTFIWILPLVAGSGIKGQENQVSLE